MNHVSCPKGYRQVGVMDFVRNRRQLLTVNIAALIAMAVMIAAGLILVPFGPTWALIREKPWVMLVLVAMYLAYIPLHELTHGILMHLLSGVKPRYGFKLCYAYAGSRVYFDRFSHNLIALAPLVLWGAVLGVLERVVPGAWFWLFYIIQISNVSGSAGDVYCVLALARYPRDILIQDTGTRMRILAPKPSDEETK